MGVVDACRVLGLQASLLSHVDGPSTMRVDVSVPAGTRAEHVTRLSGSLASHLGVTEVSIRPVDGSALAFSMTVAKPLADRSMVDLSSVSGHGWSLPLGISTDGEEVTLNIAKAPHVLVAGTSGSGKSVGLHALIHGASQAGARLWLVDPKRTEFGTWRGHPGIDRVVCERGEAAELLIDACREVDRRNEAMERRRVRTLDEWQDVDARAPARLIVVVDEYADLIAQGAGKAGRELSLLLLGSLQRVAQVGRACGVHLVLATQRPSSECLPGVLKANLDTRLIFRVSSAVDARVCGVRGAETLGGAGDALLMHAGRTVRLQVAWIDPPEEEMRRGLGGMGSVVNRDVVPYLQAAGIALIGGLIVVKMATG